MKKRSKKQQRKVNLLERDDYRCGVHFGGCGKKITLDETTVDHIIPQNIFKYDEKYKERIKFLKKLYKFRERESLAAGLLNLQPMCSDCNNLKKRGVFPPSNIIKRCSNKCCNFIYLKENKNWYLMATHYFLNKSKSQQKNGIDKGGSVFFTFPLTEVQVKYESGTKSEKQYLLYGSSKTASGFLRNQLGGSVSELNMIENNRKYNKEELFKSENRLKGEIENIHDSQIETTFNFVKYFNELIEENDKNIQSNPNDIESYMNRGFAKAKIGRYNEAIKDFNKIIQLNLNHSYKVYFNRGFCFLNLGKYNEAIDDCNKSIAINPNHSGVYFNRGLAAFHLNQYKESILDLDKSIKLDPNNAGAYNYRGCAKLNIRDYKGAMEDCNKSIELNPNDSGSYNNRALAEFHLKQYEESILDFDKGIELNPNEARAYNDRGLSKFYLGRYAESVLDFNKSIELDPNDVVACHNRSRAKLHLGQYKEATADCNKTIALNQNHSGAYNNRGIAKFKTGEYQEALKDFDKAVALNPSDKKISRNRESVLSALINKKGNNGVA